VHDCNKVIARNPKRWEAYLLKGKNFLEMPVMDSVLLVLDYARLYSNEDPATLAAISEYYLMNDESAMAIAFAEKGLQSQPYNIPLKLNKARAYDGMEQYEKANAVYNEIGTTADSIPEYHFYLGKNMLYLGDTASAVIALSDAIALRRNYSEAYTLRSIVKARIGDAVGAAEDRERAKGNISWRHPQRTQRERDSLLTAPSI
jgi:tetratricopeptide (TPR) repeat protein